MGGHYLSLTQHQWGYQHQYLSSCNYNIRLYARITAKKQSGTDFYDSCHPYTLPLCKRHRSFNKPTVQQVQNPTAYTNISHTLWGERPFSLTPLENNFVSPPNNSMPDIYSPREFSDFCKDNSFLFQCL
jgi:hypothetical protein